MMRRALQAVWVAVVVASLGVARADTIVFSDGDFESANYTAIVTGTGSSSASTEPSGGNPGAYRRISLTVGPYQSVRDIQLCALATFAPKTQGSVNRVEVSYDVRRVSSTHPWANQIGKWVAVQQDGVLHTHLDGVMTSTNWQEKDLSITDVVPLFPDVNWVDGNEVTFGFGDGVATSDIAFSLDGGYDNFRVEIDFVPEPATLALLALGGLAVMRRRR